MTTGAPARRARMGRSAVRRIDRRVATTLRVLAWLAGAGLLAAAGVSAAAVAYGGERTILVVLLAALAAWMTPLTVVALLLFAVGRHRRSAAVAVVALVGGVIWLRPFPHGNGDVANAAAGSAIEITVMSQNVLFGGVAAQEIVEAVRRERPDVLVLTELTDELAAGLQPAGLAELLPYSYLKPAPQAAGTGIWSAHPLAEGEVIGGLAFYGLDVLVRTPAGPVRLLGMHPAPPQNPLWANDFDTLRDRVAQLSPGVPVVVAGDLNATQFNAPMRRLLDVGLVDAGAARLWAWQQMTWPLDPGGPAPSIAMSGGIPAVTALQRLVRPPALLRIDHVLTPRSAEVLALESVRMPGTDHLGLVARLRLAPGE